MSTNSSNEPMLSNPWLIQFLLHDNQEPDISVNNLTKQAERLGLNEQNVPVEPKNSCSWSEHERSTGEILNEAAKRASAETFKNICVSHPTQNHMPSQDGPNIRPDYTIAWSYNGVRKNTAVVDAKDHHGNVSRSDYEKICRDMREIKATRGILVLGEQASISDKLRAEIEKDNKVDIVQMQNDRSKVVQDVTQHIGRLIDKNFIPDNKRWQTYESHVSTTENSKERRPNPHGEYPTYTRNSNYYRFNPPLKQDGTVDERYEANRDRNKDGGPDMRMAHNKSKQAQEQHLNADGSEDMRNNENREELVDQSGHRSNVDGSPDKRCTENKIETPANTTSDVKNGQANENIDMRQNENREGMVDIAGHHLNIDGTPDRRCKENQEEINAPSADELQLNTNKAIQGETNETNTAIPTKNDGTADMRYAVSKEAVAEGTIERDETLTEGNGTVSVGSNEGLSAGSSSADIPTKSDGTADMRYTESQDAVASGEISGDQILGSSISENSMGGGNEMSSSGMTDNIGFGGGGGGGDGPTKADGTPDMRFSANQ